MVGSRVEEREAVADTNCPLSATANFFDLSIINLWRRK